VKPPRARIAVSACLMGQAVRYDATHRQHEFVTRHLADVAELLALCPEQGAGFGVPRPPMELRGDPGRPRAVRIDDPSVDLTRALEAYSRSTANALAEVDGYVFKKDSPSCGLAGVTLGRAPGATATTTTGIHARIVREIFPELPVIEEDGLDDAAQREAFLSAVRAHARARMG